jgi:hypothetical protein
MIAPVPEYTGARCDFTGEPMANPVGYFARGATGRVCLVMVGEQREGDTVSTLEQIQQWAESEPNGYLDY